jgi:hypothetical protein
MAGELQLVITRDELHIHATQPFPVGWRAEACC